MSVCKVLCKIHISAGIRGRLLNCCTFYFLSPPPILSQKRKCFLLVAIVPKLNAATFAMTVVQPFLSLDSLKLIYYSYFHSILTYRIIFGVIPPTAMLFSECKRELLGSWWE